MAERHIYQLGAAETAVVSLVNLISTATGANEEKLAFWLDAYYQARLAYEKENAPEPDPTILRKSDLEPVLRQLWQETLKKSCQKEASKRMAERKAEKLPQPEIYPVTPIKPEDIPAEPLINDELIEGLAPAAAAAAAYKRNVKARLEEARKQGTSIGKIVHASDGILSENQLLTILDGGRLPIGTYRDLSAVLDKFAANT